MPMYYETEISGEFRANESPKATGTILQSTEVKLVPWDPDSPQHVQRLYDQRVICGWKKEKVEKWRSLQREGKMAIHWITLSDDDPQRATKLEQHIKKHTNEKLPILDSATTLAGKARITQRLLEPFVPVGHISLDFHHPDPSLADPSKGIFYISTFYVSQALQGGGLGRAAMDVIEKMAIEPPLQARVLALDTLAKDQVYDDDFWKNRDPSIQRPKICNQDWYARRGYEVFKRDDTCYKEFTPVGEETAFAAVFMRKTIG